MEEKPGGISPSGSSQDVVIVMSDKKLPSIIDVIARNSNVPGFCLSVKGQVKRLVPRK